MVFLIEFLHFIFFLKNFFFLINYFFFFLPFLFFFFCVCVLCCPNKSPKKCFRSFC